MIIHYPNSIQQIQASRDRKNQLERAISITFVTLAENGQIDEITAAENAAFFIPWNVSEQYKKGALRLHEGVLMKCIQDCDGSKVPGTDEARYFWKPAGDITSEFPIFSQPIGTMDAYMAGDKVTFEDKHYICTADGTFGSPDAMPDRWQEVS